MMTDDRKPPSTVEGILEKKAERLLELRNAHKNLPIDFENDSGTWFARLKPDGVEKELELPSGDKVRVSDDILQARMQDRLKQLENFAPARNFT